MRNLFKFAGNDYLGLSTHPAVLEGLYRAAKVHGVSAASSRWALGWTPLHAELEQGLQEWLECEDACIISAAYLGGSIYYSQMAALGRRVVFCDAMVHSNQFLGMRAAGLDVRTFRHLDVADLRRMTAGYDGPPAIIATDGVFGISGEVADVAALAEVAGAICAELFVDDAHGVGVLGMHGNGALEIAGLHPGGFVTVLGSMSKAMGANGGFMAGRRELVERFRRSPEASGVTSLPAPMVGAALAALNLIRHDAGLRQRMERNATCMRQILASEGVALADHRHPILGMLLRDESEAAALDQHFVRHGLWIPYFKYASEPRQNLLRGAARAVYSDEQLENFAKAVRTRPRVK